MLRGHIGHQRVQFDRSVIPSPLERRLQSEETRAEPRPVRVNLDLNPDHPRGLAGAAETASAAEASMAPPRTDGARESRLSEEIAEPYLVAVMVPSAVRWVVHADIEGAERGDWNRRAIHRVWPDFAVFPLLEKSVSTVKGERPGPRSPRTGEILPTRPGRTDPTSTGNYGCSAPWWMRTRQTACQASRRRDRSDLRLDPPNRREPLVKMSAVPATAGNIEPRGKLGPPPATMVGDYW